MRKRVCLPEAIYHVIARGNNRQPVFHVAEDYEHFLRLALSVKAKHPFALFGYCLMTNHVHLLLQPVAGSSLSHVMQMLLSRYAVHCNEQYGSEGHVWKNRFFSRVITDEIYALRALMYVELNPVRAGMVKQAEQYLWSSARAHLQRHRDPCLEPYPPLMGIERYQTYRELLAVAHDQLDLDLERPSHRGRPRKDNLQPSYPQNVSETFLGGGDG